MKYLKKFENVDIFDENEWDFEEGEDFISVPLFYEFKKGDRVKLRKDSRYRGQSGNRQGTIVSRYNLDNPYSWWNVEWEYKGDKYMNQANYPISDILIHYEDLKQNENFDFNEDDFDEEEFNYDDIKVGDKVVLKGDTCELTKTGYGSKVDDEYEIIKNITDYRLDVWFVVSNIKTRKDGVKVMKIGERRQWYVCSYWKILTEDIKDDFFDVGEDMSDSPTQFCSRCGWEGTDDELKTFTDLSSGTDVVYYRGCPYCETDADLV